jgi:hypothetical protein
MFLSRFPKLDTFWRVSVAIALGIAGYTVVCSAFVYWNEYVFDLTGYIYEITGTLSAILSVQHWLGVVGAVTAAVIVYHLLQRRPAPDRVLRCPKCDYILRGLSAPRCPECGEPI